MAQTPTTVPARFRAGDTVTWQISLADYPASAGWVLAYTLINAGGKITVTASASGDDHLVAIAAATSANYAPGTYSWQATVTKAAERYTVATGSLIIDPDLASEAGGFDDRTTAQRLLDAVEAVLANRATRSDLEYEIAGRRMKSMTHGELLAARDKLKREVAGERRAAGLSSGGQRVLVRF